MTLRTKLLIAGAMLSIAGMGAAVAETQRPFDRLAQFKKDPETDPGGLPGRSDDRPPARTRGMAPASPAYRPPAKDEEKAKAPAAESSTPKKEGSEKR